MLVACKTPDSEVEPTPLKPVVNVVYKSEWPEKDWTMYAVNAFKLYGKDMLKVTPLDASNYCPQIKDMNEEQRVAFYNYLLSAMAKHESNFKPNTNFTEGFNDSKGKRVISRGLLQLSQESANGYKCGITEPTMLHDPKINIECSVRILNQWISRDKYIGGTAPNIPNAGGARYWSVLRNSSGSQPQIMSRVKKYCTDP